MSRPLHLTRTRANTTTCRALGIQIGDAGAILHIGGVASVIEVAQITHVYRERAPGGENATDITDLF